MQDFKRGRGEDVREDVGQSQQQKGDEDQTAKAAQEFASIVRTDQARLGEQTVPPVCRDSMKTRIGLLALASRGLGSDRLCPLLQVGSWL